MSEITAEELRERLDAGEDLYLVDVRSKADYDAETIEGAENLPIREALLDGDLDTVQRRLDELPDDREIVAFCDAGASSGETARMLSERGRDAKALEGGLNNWKESQRS